MLLLTGATGPVGRALLARLTAARTPVRCLVRDPKRLGPDRVRVQLALGDLAEPASFRNALRGVKTVVHLAAAARDQRAGSIEELTGIATWRMVEAAQRAGVERFVFVSALGAAAHSRTRFLRAKALAQDAVRESPLRTTVLAPSLMFTPGDLLTGVPRRLSLLPVVPVSGRGRCRSQPIWAEDVADCLQAVLDRDGDAPEHVDLAGPETLTYDAIVRTALRAGGRSRPIVHVPTPVVSRTLRATEALLKSKAPVTWDEAELLEVDMTTRDGTAGAESLGVTPRSLAAVLGV